MSARKNLLLRSSFDNCVGWRQSKTDTESRASQQTSEEAEHRTLNELRKYRILGSCSQFFILLVVFEKSIHRTCSLPLFGESF